MNDENKLKLDVRKLSSEMLRDLEKVVNLDGVNEILEEIEKEDQRRIGENH